MSVKKRKIKKTVDAIKNNLHNINKAEKLMFDI